MLYCLSKSTQAIVSLTKNSEESDSQVLQITGPSIKTTKMSLVFEWEDAE